MKETPIIFSTPMVRAILEGNKTMTRRVVKPQPENDDRPINIWIPGSIAPDGMKYQNIICPYGQKGDLLWVRETWAIMVEEHDEYPYDISGVVYKATDANANPDKWKPPIFMPKKYARIWLEIVNIRVERLQDIGQGSACAEGAPSPYEPIEWFSELWDSINGKKHPWSSNPWVWVITFKKREYPK